MEASCLSCVVSKVPTSPFLSFKSHSYPGDRIGWPVFHEAIGRPLSVALLVLSIAAFVLVLRDLPIERFVLTATPACLTAAALWARWQMGLTVVQIDIQPNEARISTLWHRVLRQQPPWQTILDVSLEADRVRVVVGVVTYDLHRSEWPQFEELVAAFQSSKWHASL